MSAKPYTRGEVEKDGLDSGPDCCHDDDKLLATIEALEAAEAGAADVKRLREEANVALRKLADIERQYRAKVQRMVWLEKALGIYDERAIDREK